MHVLRPLRAAALVFLLVVAADPSLASAVTVAQPGAATTVREYNGTIVFSEYDLTEHQWYLDVREPGAGQRRLPVAPSPVQFQADIGPGSDGRPELIYRRCSGTDRAPVGCDLYIFSLTHASGERPVRNANDAANNDVTPTLWKGRIAWTRVFGSGETANPVIYTKLLTAPRSQPSKRLPGGPMRLCAEPGLMTHPCGPTRRRNVDGLELRGDDLGMVIRYSFVGLPGHAEYDVRLDRVQQGSGRKIASIFSGELSGQYLVGPSLFGGTLAWYKGCADTGEASCRKLSGSRRYAVSTGHYTRSIPGPVVMDDFADSGSELYEVLGCEYSGNIGTPGYPPLPGGCRIDAIPAPTYARAPAGRG